jgi:hypothetical protein
MFICLFTSLTAIKKIKRPFGMNDFERRKCLELTNRMLHMDLCRPFREKVDPIRDGAPGYNEVIKNPMDLGTVKKLLTANEFKHITEWSRAVNLIWSNAMAYNQQGTLIQLIAQEMEMWFRRNFENLPRNKDEEWMNQLRKSSKRMLDLSLHPPPSMIALRVLTPMDFEQVEHTERREPVHRVVENEPEPEGDRAPVHES